MKFRFIITDTFDGYVKGSNSPEAAASYAKLEEFFVYDTQDNKWMQPDGGKIDIHEIAPPSEVL